MIDTKFIIHRIIGTITGTSVLLGLVSLFAMMLLITLDVILNKVIGRPLPGTIEITSYYFMVLIVFLVLPSIEKNQSHISADFIVARFNRTVQNYFAILGKVLTIVFYSLLMYAAYNQAIKSTQRLETVMSNFTFYIWPARWGVVLGLFSAIMVAVLVIAHRIKK
jgi:TRAP-type C4-dicarboxylate transport system permease small subunit